MDVRTTFNFSSHSSQSQTTSLWPVTQKVLHTDLHQYKLAGEPPQLVATDAMDPLLAMNSKAV